MLETILFVLAAAFVFSLVFKAFWELVVVYFLYVYTPLEPLAIILLGVCLYVVRHWQGGRA